MALRQVKEYYKNVEKLYFDMVHSLEGMQEEFKKGNVTEEELNKLLMSVNNIRDNYLRLSYIMYLFYAPNKKEKIPAYKKQEQKMETVFEQNKVTKEQDLQKSNDALEEFKKHLEEFKKEKEND